MKKKSMYIIVILSLCLMVCCFLLVASQSQTKELQKNIDQAFIRQLGNTHGSFSVKVDEYTYRSMISNVSAVAAMSNLTSYEEVNDDLDISLYNLYFSLREDRSKDKVLARMEELREIFYSLVRDPTSKEATNRLMQIADETFFNVKK